MFAVICQLNDEERLLKIFTWVAGVCPLELAARKDTKLGKQNISRGNTTKRNMYLNCHVQWIFGIPIIPLAV